MLILIVRTLWMSGRSACSAMALQILTKDSVNVVQRHRTRQSWWRLSLLCCFHVATAWYVRRCLFCLNSPPPIWSCVFCFLLYNRCPSFVSRTDCTAPPTTSAAYFEFGK